MSTDNCKLCGQNKKLVAAHIIPRSFFHNAKGVSKSWSEARRYDTKDVKIWQSGFCDNRILCNDCERGFSNWDGYGYRVLGTPPGTQDFPRTQTQWEAFVIRDVDYTRFKLFVLSVLWRASTSSLPFFTRVQLGPHEATIANLIRKRDPGSEDQFQVVLARLVGQRYPNVIYPPCWQRTPEGVNFNLLFLPSIKIMVKVDQRPIPTIFADGVLRNRRDNILLPMPLLTHEIQALRNGAEIFLKREKRRERSAA